LRKFRPRIQDFLAKVVVYFTSFHATVQLRSILTSVKK